MPTRYNWTKAITWLVIAILTVLFWGYIFNLIF